VGLVFGYTLLGSTWLVIKTEGAIQLWAVKWARIALIGVIAFIAMVSIWTPLSDPGIAARWFGWPNLAFLAPLPIATGIIALWLWRSLDKGRDIVPFFAAIGLFAMCFLGLGISLWPNIVPPAISLWEAAASPRSQAFLLIGTLFLLPIIIVYTGWSYYVFRGKVRADAGYH
jgi:cytochrome d ubiquinol oxidase subunit II